MIIYVLVSLDFDSDSEDSDDMDVDSSEDSSSTSSSESSDNSDDPDLPTPAEIYIHHMANLYSERYMAKRANIPKSQTFMHLFKLLNDYKVNHPIIFRNYLVKFPLFSAI